MAFPAPPGPEYRRPGAPPEGHWTPPPWDPYAPDPDGTPDAPYSPDQPYDDPWASPPAGYENYPRPTVTPTTTPSRSELSIRYMGLGSDSHRTPKRRHNAHHAARHSEASIHRRHLARVEYGKALKTYHAALRNWRKLIRARDELIKKLASIEKRLLQTEQAHHHRSTITYEIQGIWYHQHGHGPAHIIKDPTK